jgi:DNA-binding CsgD family transcriptional regulator
VETTSEFNIGLMERIKSLVDYLRLRPANFQSVMQFVAIDTLYPLSAIALCLNVVRLDGSVIIPAWYGLTREQVESIPDRFVGVDSPVNRSLRTGNVVDCGSFDTYLFAGPDYPVNLFPKGFASSVAWPIPGVGSVVTFCSQANEWTLETELFLMTIGGILALEFENTPIGGFIHREGHPGANVSPLAMTARQWTIVAAIRRGLTNPEIAKDLGFSESLVRQETMQIYRKLQVSGRKELIESDHSEGNEGQVNPIS